MSDDFVVRRIAEVGWAVFARNSGEKVAPGVERRWFPSRRFAVKAADELQRITDEAALKLAAGGDPTND